MRVFQDAVGFGDLNLKLHSKVTVDECIPCHVRRKHNPKPYTIFAKPRGEGGRLFFVFECVTHYSPTALAMGS